MDGGLAKLLLYLVHGLLIIPHKLNVDVITYA